MIQTNGGMIRLRAMSLNTDIYKIKFIRDERFMSKVNTRILILVFF